MDKHLQVKQRLGQITGAWGNEIAVYISGVPGWYVFRSMQEVSPGTYVETTIEWAKHGSELKRGWKQKLH